MSDSTKTAEFPGKNMSNKQKRVNPSCPIYHIYMMEHKENNTTKVEHISYLFIIYTCINNIINTFCI